MIKGVLLYLIDAATVKAQFLIRFAMQLGSKTPVHREDGKNLNFSHNRSLFVSFGKGKKAACKHTTSNGVPMFAIY